MTLYTVTSVCEGLLTPGTERLDKNDSHIRHCFRTNIRQSYITDNRRGNLLHGFASNRYKEKN